MSLHVFLEFGLGRESHHAELALQPGPLQPQVTALVSRQLR